MQVDGSALEGRWWRCLAAGVLAVGLPIAGFAVAGPAAAQTDPECDPFYGCDPDEPDDSVTVTCSVTGEVFVAGDDGAVLVSGAPAGATIALTLDGTVVGNGTANADGNATVTFVVPDDTTPGPHTIFAQGAGFGASCGTIQVDAVLAEQDTQPGGGDPQGTSDDDVRGGSGNRSLARTGMELAMFLAVALVLLVAGSRLVSMARRRRRRAVRRENAVASLARE